MPREKVRPYQNYINSLNPFCPTDTTQYYPSILSFNSNNSIRDKTSEFVIPNSFKQCRVSLPLGGGSILPSLPSQLPIQAKPGRWQVSPPFIIFRHHGNYSVRFEKMFSFARWDEGRHYEKADIFKAESTPETRPARIIEAPRRIRKKGAGRKTANPAMEISLIDWFKSYINEKSTLIRTISKTKRGDESGQIAEQLGRLQGFEGLVRQIYETISTHETRPH